VSILENAYPEVSPQNYLEHIGYSVIA
jgi:hypothetical protein